MQVWCFLHICYYCVIASWQKRCTWIAAAVHDQRTKSLSIWTGASVHWLWRLSKETGAWVQSLESLSIWTGVCAYWPERSQHLNRCLCSASMKSQQLISAIKAEPECPRSQLIFNFLSSSALSQVNFLYLEFSLYFIRNKESRTLDLSLIKSPYPELSYYMATYWQS